MSGKRPPANPLLGVSHFKLEDSFGVQPTLVVPPAASSSLPTSSSNDKTPSLFNQGQPQSSADPFSDINLNSNSPVKPPPIVSSAPPAPPPVMSLGPPQPGLFLLPTSGSGPGAPPPASLPAQSTTSSKPRSRYVPPPGIHSSSSSGNLAMPASIGVGPPPLAPNPGPGSFMMPDPAPPSSQSSLMQGSSSVPDFGAFQQMHPNAPELYPGQHGNRTEVIADEPVYHWYYKLLEKNHNVLNPAVDTTKINETWKPFSMRDSMSLEHFYNLDKNTSVLIPSDGGRYDVNLPKRTKTPVYWKDGLNDEMQVVRASWFYKTGVNSWAPYAEDLACKLESEYQSCIQTGQWKREIRIQDTNESIRIIGPKMMFHLPTEHSGGLSGKLDEWGQVQPPSQDPSQVPREVHRGVEGIIDDIPDGEDMTCDHLVFVIHGIGGACDMKFRPIHQVVDSYRDLTAQLSKKHFQRAHLMEQVSRIEFLPVNWHKPLHGEDTGTDERLRPLTLKSIPKLRNFVNDTLLDILFYTSPIYCQSILDTVVSEINRIYTLFCERNEDFNGKISIIGHSLGSLIAFDLLSHQSSTQQEEHVVVEKPPALDQVDVTLEQVFCKLDMGEYAENFTKEGIDMEALMLCNEDDLKEGGLPLGPRKKLLHYLDVRKAILEKKLSGLEEYQEASITSDVKYRIGPAGTGQPSVFYPKLDFEPASFYALGSPIALFNAVRGIQNLGPGFKLPTCSKFFNIFHPYDPVAYRLESLIDPDYANLRPVTIPHHAGRKRMHLELKDTVTKLMTGDLKKKLMDSVWSSLSAIYNTATGSSSNEAEQKAAVEEAVETKLAEEDELDCLNPSHLDAALNSGQRIDFVLQEAPYESFNEYVFALGSHLCYWESEDTSLMILKDILSGIMGVASDAQLAQSEQQVQAPAEPPFIDNTPTAILRPPPTPMGGQMPVVTTTSGSSTLVPPGSIPLLPPTAAPITPVSLGPPTTSANVVTSTPVSDSSNFLPPMTPVVAGGPPPPMMSPATFGSAAVTTTTNLGRPRRAVYPIQGGGAQPMGMDPTAPPSHNPNIGPPPTSGFSR